MTLNNRLLMVLLGLPLVLLAVVAGIGLQLESQDRRQALQERLALAADLLAPELEAALQGTDNDSLSRIGGRLLDQEEIRAVAIRGADGDTLVELGRLRDIPDAEPARGGLFRDGHQWRLQTPLMGQAPGEDTAGWLVMDIDAMPLALDHYRRLATAGLGLLIIGLFLWLIAYSTSRRLTQPIQAADRALARLANGDCPPPLDVSSITELAGLTRRVNQLSEQFAQSRQDVQRQIEQTTAELQESMETIEVQNIELDMAHRRALQANRVKSEFLANMSHEIRTPLNGIIGFCRLLGRSRLEERQREWLDHVHRACDNLLMLVNDVLDFSKLEAGRLELEHLPVDMVALVDEVLGLQAPDAHSKGLHLLGRVYDDVPTTLNGDPLRIRQVLTNLVNNAIKFTESGEVIVRVMVEQAEPGRVTLRISVSDTGIGLSRENCQRLFQAFRQGAPSHPREFGGTGLGLTICRQLLEQMGGTIEVESQLDRGSTFTLTLPLGGDEDQERPVELLLTNEIILLEEPHPATHRALAHLLGRSGARVVDADASQAREASPTLFVAGLASGQLDDQEMATWAQRLAALDCPTLLLVNASPMDLPSIALPRGGQVLSKPVSRAVLIETLRTLLNAQATPLLPEEDDREAQGSQHILVVDDAETNRLLLEELIQRPGLLVQSAASGEESLAMAQTQDYDLVLMDIRMSGMDGVEATRALRRLEGAWHDVPIIAVTAHALEGERHRLLANGLDEILIKPLDAWHLEDLLHRHLKLPARQDSLVPGTTPESTTVDKHEDGELAVVDLTLGTQPAGGRDDLARELVERLAETLPETRTAIQRALETHDDEGLLDAIHALNGACRYCGTPRLGLLAETLETRLRSRGREAVLPLVDDLFDAMSAVIDWQARQSSSTTKARARSTSSVNDR
ncbi:ATP-binding protein [Halomonas sp.]|uniref:ATP-binding protein n=1 Tax=Halomonas sp. TaxID=1486246 RepID=UPI00356322C6